MLEKKRFLVHTPISDPGVIMTKSATLNQEASYNINITGRHMMVTEGMKQHAIAKLSKLEKLAHHIIDVHVIMDIQKHEHRVDIVLKFSHTKIKVEAHSEDMYSSIDRAVEKLQGQLLKYKERLQGHQAKGLSVVEMNVNVLANLGLNEINDEIDALNNQQAIDQHNAHSLVKQEVRPLKILTQDEAIMKMDLSQDHFMIYRDEKSHKLKVIYRRNDGHYGVIEPER